MTKIDHLGIAVESISAARGARLASDKVQSGAGGVMVMLCQDAAMASASEPEV